MKALFLIIAFMAVVYIYTYIKGKRTRRKTQAINTVADFRRLYSKKEPPQTYEENTYTKYITKYNSSIDFIDKADFIKEVQQDTKE